MDEIKQDIQKARDIADDIKALSRKQGFSGNINGRVVNCHEPSGRSLRETS